LVIYFNYVNDARSNTHQIYVKINPIRWRTGQPVTRWNC